MRKLNVFRFALCLVFLMCVFGVFTVTARAASSATYIHGGSWYVDEGDEISIVYNGAYYDSAYSFQWQYRFVGSSYWTNYTGTGCKTNTMTFTAPSASSKPREYRVRVYTSSTKSFYTSDVSQFTFCTPLEVIDQPVSVTMNEGEINQFIISAVGDELSYVWQYSMNGGISWENTSSRSASHSVMGSLLRDGWLFRCKVTDKWGRSVYTDVVSLTVLEDESIVQCSAYESLQVLSAATYEGKEAFALNPDMELEYTYTDFSIGSSFHPGGYVLLDKPGVYTFEFSGYDYSCAPKIETSGDLYDFRYTDVDMVMYLEVDGDLYRVSQGGNTVITVEHPSDQMLTARLLVEYEIDGVAFFYVDDSSMPFVEVTPTFNFSDVSCSFYITYTDSVYPLDVQAVDWLSKIRDSVNDLNVTLSNDQNTHTGLLEAQNDLQRESNSIQQSIDDRSQMIVDYADEALRGDGHDVGVGASDLNNIQDTLTTNGFLEVDFYAVDYYNFEKIGTGFISAFMWISYMIENIFALTEFSAVIFVIYGLLLAVILLGLRRLWR